MANSSAQPNILIRFIKSATTIEPDEVKATLLSFGLVFVLMASYYILRPVRDSFASDWTRVERSTLWTFTFVFSVIATALYGFAASKISLKKLVPFVYAFFSATFVGVYVLSELIDNADLVRRFFYVWVSVFSLFHLSVFWSFMSDLYSKEQSKRLFGFITTGASVGALVGPSIPLLFASSIGTNALLLIASVVLLFTIPLILYIQSFVAKEMGVEFGQSEAQLPRGMGGNPLAGFSIFVKNPFLLGIGAFIFLYTAISTFIYFDIADMLVDYTEAQRTQVWAFMDLATNAITIVTGLFVTSRLATKMGLAFTLALVPVVVCLGLFTMALVPIVWILVGFQIFRRSGNYGITRPAREMLFTVVDQETRFKAKQVVDVVVYRGGDVFWAWFATALTALFGLGLAGTALVGAVIAAIWALLGVRLGKRFSAVSGEKETGVEPETEAVA